MTQNGTYPTGTYVKDGKERVALSTRAAVKLSFEGYTLKDIPADFPTRTLDLDGDGQKTQADLAPVEDDDEPNDDEPFELDDEDSEVQNFGDNFVIPRPSDTFPF